MIGYVRGVISHLFTESCFVDVQGVGYRVHISSTTRQKLIVGETATLMTYFSVREDALLLYGFLSATEYELFVQLISVSGIGPKVAVGILSFIEPDAFRLAISQKNLTVLTKLPGVGKKTGERLILELKDKMGTIMTSDDTDRIETTSHSDDIYSQALQALISLGYTQNEVVSALRSSASTAKSVEDAIKFVLRELGGGRN